MKSYATGPRLPLPDLNFGEALAASAARNPEGDAIVSCHQGVHVSFREFQREVHRVACGLWALGIRPRDRVGMWASSCAEWVYLQFATAEIGAVLVNVNPAYRSHELRFVLRRSEMKAIFLRDKDGRANYLDILNEARRGEELPLCHVITLGSDLWEAMISAGIEPEPVHIAIDDVVNIQYTSGTTGSPKGVLLTHRNLTNNAWLIGRQLKIRSDDRICAPVPMYHCFGCVIGSLVAAVYGVALILPAPQFDALAALTAVEKERCTLLYGVPTMFIAELEHPEFHKFDLRSLRGGVMAGAPCPVDVMKRVVSEMNCHGLVIGYGLTETSPIITMSEPEDPVELRVATVGRVLPNTEAKIVARETGEIVDVGRPGEICTRGYHVMKGYDKEPDATAATIDPEGWLRTGDLASMDEQGCFHIVGRSKEMICRGGENIYPREVEEFLHGHPKIADVYVVGVPDARLGETVLAAIRLRAGAVCTEADVRDFCRGRIAHFKIPQYIRFVDSFPLTVTGKVQKFKIREAEIESLGLRPLADVQIA